MVRLFVLSLVHFVNDAYSYFLYAALPFLLAAHVVDVAQGSLMVAAFTLTSAVAQPLFGYLVDRAGQNWPVYIGTAWMGTLVSLLGILRGFPLLLGVAAAAGLGTAAFHPQGASLVAKLSHRPGLLMSAFIAAGNLGMAASPILGTSWLDARGLASTPLLILPGLGAALILLVTLSRWPESQRPRPTGGTTTGALVEIKRRWSSLAIVFMLISLRTTVSFGLLALLPPYLRERGVPLVLSGRYLSLLLFAGVLAGFMGGYLSDRLGTRTITTYSLLLAIPSLYLFLHQPGAASVILLAVSGAFLMASVPATVVAAQRLLPGNVALASAFGIGMPIGLGGLGVAVLGSLAQQHGLTFTLDLLPILLLPISALGFFLPGQPPKAS